MFPALIVRTMMVHPATALALVGDKSGGSQGVLWGWACALAHSVSINRLGPTQQRTRPVFNPGLSHYILGFSEARAFWVVYARLLELRRFSNLVGTVIIPGYLQASDHLGR